MHASKAVSGAADDAECIAILRAMTSGVGVPWRCRERRLLRQMHAIALAGSPARCCRRGYDVALLADAGAQRAEGVEISQSAVRRGRPAHAR